MRSFTIYTLLIISMFATASAWGAPQKNGDREQWMTEMRQYKRTYLTRELGLSREQQNSFYPLYEEMEDKVEQVNSDARTMEKRVSELPDATDLDYEKATEAIYDAAVKSAQIEREYMEKFKSILSKKQLFKLKAAERQFTREIMKQHQRLRSRGGRGGQPADRPN